MKARHVAAMGVLLGLAAGGVWLWRAHARAETFHASVPARPALGDSPRELTRRIAAAETSARRDHGVTALAELGQLYHANGFLAEAVQCYRGLATLESKNPRWPHRLACIYAGFGDLESALALWTRVGELAPDYVPALVRRGDVLLKLNRPREAAAAFATALRHDARNPHALAGLARIDIAAQRWADARARLEHAAEASSGRIGADLLATACEQLGDQARAMALRGRAKSSGAFHDPPDPWLDEIMEDCFDAYRIAVAAGFADHAGDTKAARRLIDRALLLAPDDAGALFQSGNFALAQRDYERARRDFEACVRAAPEFSDGWARLIHVHGLLGNPAAAEAALSAGLKHCPTSLALQTQRANRVAAAGRPAEAAAMVEAALRNQPNDAEALVKLASFYFQLERLDDGAMALQRALMAEPEHPGALTTLALHAIGRGDERQAREWLQRVRWQLRVPRELVDQLANAYRERFGRPAP